MMTTLALILSLSGNVLLIYQRREGFVCWAVANAIWLPDAVLRQDWPQSLLWTVYLVLAVIGWWRWKIQDGRGHA